MIYPVRLLLIAVGIFFSFIAEAKLILSFEQKLVLNLALQSYALPEEEKQSLIDQAMLWGLENAKIGTSVIRVKNFQEFLDQYSGQWPNESTLQQDLAFVLSQKPRGIPVFVCQSPRIQKQIDEFIVSQQLKLAENPEVQKILREFAAKSQAQPELVRMLLAPTWGMNYNNEAVKKLFAVMNEPINVGVNSALDQLKQIGTKVAVEGFSEQKDLVMKKVMQVLLSEYYSSLSLPSQKKIISDILNADLEASPLQKFEILVQNSGPQLQKLLQIVARQGDLDPAMKAVFSKLESSVKPVPWQRVQKILDTEKQNYEFIYFERKALGVGTMAQVHRAKILLDGERQDVVVRFLKPDISLRVEEDHRILQRVAAVLDSNQEFRSLGAPLLLPLVEDITNTVRAELDVESTIKRQVYARKVYEKLMPLELENDRRYVQFKVPKVIEPKKQSALMIQEMVIGRKLDKEVLPWQELMPDLKQAIMESLAKLWANELIFGSGFFHSDLHQGNFLVSVKEPNIEVSILDFGMGGKISKSLQSKVIIFGAAIELKRADLLAKSLLSIADKSQSSVIIKSDLQLAVQKRMELAQSRQEKMGPEAWTAWATTMGLKLPYDFISLNRGIAILNKSLQESGSSKSFVSLVRDLAVQNPLHIVKALLKESSFEVRDWALLGFGEVQKRISQYDFVQSWLEPIGKVQSDSLSVPESIVGAESSSEKSPFISEEAKGISIHLECSQIFAD